MLLALACAPLAPEARLPGDPAALCRYDQVCADGDMVYGIDVSYWQSTIDWTEVAGAGTSFAIARVSHGLGTYDTQFQANWAGIKANGMVRGAYQYFDGNDDPTAQAELLLEEMGELEEGDLPPVLDVETGDNEDVSVSAMVAAIQEWMAVVEGALGRKPIIYTGAYAWESMTDNLDMGENPLWTAHWTDECPYVPTPWDRWTFWQYSATGSVPGISGDVDLDAFNGGAADLDDWAVHPEEECSGSCAVAEDTTLEEDAACACPAGSLDDISGHDGHAYSVVGDGDGDGVSWPLSFAQGGSYALYLWVPAGSWTAGAVVEISHGGQTQTVTVRQSEVQDDWVHVADLSFAATGTQSVTVEDVSGDGGAVAIDAIRLVLAEGACACAEGESKEMACSDGSVRTRDCDGCDWEPWSACVGKASVVEDEAGCSCAQGPEGGLVAGLVALGALRRRRAGRPAQKASPTSPRNQMAACSER